MSATPENDPDGVVGRDDETGETAETAEVHENTREDTAGVETRGDGGAEDTAIGLIGNGGMTDPRYLAPR